MPSSDDDLKLGRQAQPSIKTSLQRASLTLLHSSDTRRLLIILQAHQHLSHPLLTAPLPTTDLTFPTQIHQLRDSLPTGAARRGIFSLGQEFLCLLPNLCFLTVDFAIVGLVEAVNVFLGCGDGLLFLLLGSFVAAGNIGVSLLPPGANRFGLGLCGGGVVAAVAGAGGCYGAAWSDALYHVNERHLAKEWSAYIVSCINSREGALKAVHIIILCSGGLRCREIIATTK